MHRLARLDHAHVWHPFTQMQDWLQQEPIVLVGGKGAMLMDVRGRRYLDANASIWTNLHGHNHPKLNAALRNQLKRVAHVSALGFANAPASELAERLVKMANTVGTRSGLHGPLQNVFYSDNGSTAVEVALKLSYEYSRRTRGPGFKPRYLSLQGAYHGDTVGAVSLGQIPLFHRNYAGLLFKTDAIPAPYCYRCPHNRAQPERADARSYRSCQWECLRPLEKQLEQAHRKGKPYSAFVFEPRIQGAAGMIAQPDGWLAKATLLVRDHGAQLVADEVMTGFGRTGSQHGPSLFACGQEGIQPDFLCVAKGLAGGYLPLAATLTTQEVFNAFLGRYDEFKTFFHGHSFTGNPLAAATALASVQLLSEQQSLDQRRELESVLQEALESLWSSPYVGDIRQVGLVAGIELVRNWRTREAFRLEERAGIRVCDAMARRGVLTRPIGNVIVLMPPYCTTPRQLKQMVTALRDGIDESLGRF